MQNHPISVGTVMVAKNPQQFTNAIVIDETNNGMFVLLTDFGNQIHISTENISDYFEVSKGYLEALEIGYPLPTIEERIKHQIQLLRKALVTVKQLNAVTKSSP